MSFLFFIQHISFSLKSWENNQIFLWYVFVSRFDWKFFLKMFLFLQCNNDILGLVFMFLKVLWTNLNQSCGSGSIFCGRALKEDTDETFFRFFLYISVRQRSLTMLIRYFKIPIRIDGDIRDRKLTLCIIDTESRRLRISMIRRVANSAYHWYRESTSDLKKNEFGCEEVDSSPHHWYNESQVIICSPFSEL